MTAASPSTQWVWLARIRRPQGRKGEVFAEILTDFPEKFADRKRLWLLPDPAVAKGATGMITKSAGAKVSGAGPDRPRPDTPQPDMARPDAQPADPAAFPDRNLREVSLRDHWLHKGGVVLHFAGIDSISAAETLAGLLVAVPFTERAQLPEDEVHIADLIGCTLIDVGGADAAEIGPIENVDRSAGPVPLLIVKGPKGEVLVPFAQSYAPQLNLAARRLQMALPQGLLDLNS